VDTPLETRHRPAVRIVCLDAAGRVLLMQWQDPADGARLWEPPGGGIDPGETPLHTARRELTEETGLDPAAIGEQFVEVERDVLWNGARYTGVEQFFLARFPTDRPALTRAGLLPDEQVNLQAHRWLSRTELDALAERLEPPTLPDIVSQLLGHPWTA
jgi:8-oxo-dGTP pyrophosphatase MutT (NUDIX family)